MRKCGRTEYLLNFTAHHMWPLVGSVLERCHFGLTDSVGTECMLIGRAWRGRASGIPDVAFSAMTDDRALSPRMADSSSRTLIGPLVGDVSHIQMVLPETRVEHDKALGRVIIGLMKDDSELFEQFSDNSGFRRWLSDWVFAETYAA